MSFAATAAILVREPFHMRIADIADLTDWQIAHVLARDPQEDTGLGGGPMISVPKTYREVFWGVWQSRGMSEDDIRACWNAKYPNDPV